MCGRCYYATARGYDTYEEQLAKRNYMLGSVGVLTDRKGDKWIIDAEDFPELSKYFWVGHPAGYARNSKLGFLHRHLMPSFSVVDHIDRDPKNNRKSNLRDGSNGINGINRVPSRNSASGFRGVYRTKDMYQARMSIGKKRHYIGTFSTPEEAASKLEEFMESNNLIQYLPSPN